MMNLCIDRVEHRSNSFEKRNLHLLLTSRKLSVASHSNKVTPTTVHE